MAQGSLDAALEVRRCGGGIGDPAAGPNELQLGDPERIAGLQQVVVAAVETTGQGTSQGKELMHKAAPILLVLK
jgi:hypothetical protein